MQGHALLGSAGWFPGRLGQPMTSVSSQPNGAYCSDHSECHSRCCIWLTTVSPHRCVPQSRVLVQCLLLVSPQSTAESTYPRDFLRLCPQRVGLGGCPFLGEIGLYVHFIKRESADKASGKETGCMQREHTGVKCVFKDKSSARILNSV